MFSNRTAALPPAALALLVASQAAGQCPPGMFDYGPTRDPAIASIVLFHHGSAGPLLPDPADYARAERDAALIRAATPAMSGPGANLGYAFGKIIIRAPEPFSNELICANEFYQGRPRRLFMDFWVIDFPQVPFNCYAMAAIYEALPGVLDASPDGTGCAGICCYTYWRYEPRPGGAWRWTILDNWGGGSSACWPREWTIDTTADGAVIILQGCYQNCDGSREPPVLNVGDFMCFQTRFALGEAYADCNHSGSIDVNDFVCFQGAFAAGCP